MNTSLTHRIIYVIIREAAGLSYGANYRDHLEASKINKLSDVIGYAGISTDRYAPFANYNFTNELTDRNASISNLQTIHFVDRRLLGLKPYHIVEKWTTAGTI